MKKNLILTVLLFICYTRSFSQDSYFVYDSISDTYKINENYVIGKEFSIFETISLNSDTISSNDLTEKVVFINFWFESCAPCIAELDALSDLYSKYKNNISFQFLSFSIDNVEIAKKAVSKNNIYYTVCPISRELAYKLNFNCGFPTNIIINKEGKIVYFKSGGFTEKEKIDKDFAKIDEVIAKLLKSNK